jgi:hypothetical protein
LGASLLKAASTKFSNAPNVIRVSRETSYRLIVSGDLGPKEIGKLIKLLKVQRAVLSNDDDGKDDDDAN